MSPSDVLQLHNMFHAVASGETQLYAMQYPKVRHIWHQTALRPYNDNVAILC